MITEYRKESVANNSQLVPGVRCNRPAEVWQCVLRSGSASGRTQGWAGLS